MRLALQMRTGLERETLPSDYRRGVPQFHKTGDNRVCGR